MAVGRRRVTFTRNGTTTTILATIAVGAAITGGIVGGAFNTPDVNAPGAFLTAPAAGATLTGSVTVSANCGDNVGISGVQFKVDGTNQGAEDTSAPYSISWDTTGATNASHAVSFVCRDAAGLTASNSVSVQVSNGGAAPAGTANLFVDGNGGTCTRSSSLVSYVDAAACGTFALAEQAASCGDTVDVIGAAYGTQTIGDDSTHDANCTSSSRITIQNAPGDTVNVHGLALGRNSGGAIQGPQHLYIKGITSTTAADNGTSPNVGNDFIIGPAANDIVLDGITITGNRLDLAGASNISVINSTFSNCIGSDTKNCPVKLEGGLLGVTSYNNSNVTFTNDVFHDFTLTQSAHVECMFVQEVATLTITNSEFYHCQIFDIFMQQTGLSGTNVSNVTIRNNLFGSSYSDTGWTTPNSTCVVLDGAQNFSNFNFSFNSTYAGAAQVGGVNKGCSFQVQNSATVSGASVAIGNVLTSAGCAAGVTYSYNVIVPFSQFTGNATCGTGDSLVTYNVPANVKYTNQVDLTTGDWTLQAAAPGVGLVPAASCPATDYAGTSRPSSNHSSFCNAGAYENR